MKSDDVEQEWMMGPLHHAFDTTVEVRFLQGPEQTPESLSRRGYRLKAEQL